VVIDDVIIHLIAGHGGSGCGALVKTSDNKKIGIGGNGSRGANIILRVNPHFYDLGKFRYHKKFVAKGGHEGLPNNKTGRVPEDLILEVPPGTLIKDMAGNIIADMSSLDDTLRIAAGGRGGQGNNKQNVLTAGESGEKRDVVLDYRIPNDVAILGLPNSGKTSLFNILTAKHYKVADYPFTTTSCVWGSYEQDFRLVTFLDTPPLMQGFSLAKSEKSKFLKHLYRSRIIILAVDEARNYRNTIKLLRHKIEIFDVTLLNDKKVFYLLTKADKIENKDCVADVLPVSINNPASIERLKESIHRELFSS